MLSPTNIGRLPQIPAADRKNSYEPQLFVVGHVAGDTLQVRRVEKPAFRKLDSESGDGLGEHAGVYPGKVAGEPIARECYSVRRISLPCRRTSARRS